MALAVVVSGALVGARFVGASAMPEAPGFAPIERAHVTEWLFRLVARHGRPHMIR